MNPQSLNDELLVRASFGGNTEAFGNLVRKYQSFVCAVTFGATGSIDKSEELAQEVFVLAWQNLPQLKNHAKFKSWLYTITKNQIRKFYRHQRKDPIAHAVTIERADSIKDTSTTPPETAISQEQQDFIREALNNIPANYREPLVLFYREGKSVRQVADFFDLSEAAAKQRLSRARQMIKSNLTTMLEQTLAHTRSKESFSLAVLGMIAAGGTLTKTTAAASTAQSGYHLLNSLIHSMTAKITTAAAVAVIGTGTITYVVSQQVDKPVEPPVQLLPIEMDEGLVLHLSFDTVQTNDDQVTITDESRIGNHGRLTGGEFVKGRIGQALKCSQKNKTDGVIVKDHDSLDLNAVTIAAWIKTDTVNAQWGRILDKGWETAYNLCIGGDYRGRSWYRNRSHLECAGRTVTSKTSIADNRWHLIAGTYDGQTMRLYIDGKLDSEQKLKKPQNPLDKPKWDEAVPMKHTDTDIHIASLAVPEQPPNEEAFFDGLIDEVRLYNRVLSPEEVHTLYRYQPY